VLRGLGAVGIRLLAFTLTLSILLLWEWGAPARRRALSRGTRWSTNFLLGAVGTGLASLVPPAGAVGAALLAARHGIGLFNAAPLPLFVATLASVALLDVSVYLQHRLFHEANWLWRVHRVHHADPELDVSTAVRFHPVEILLYLLIKITVVVAFGMPAGAVLAFEVLLNATAMFNHANLSLPRVWERALRVVLVTPAMHRVHHSPIGGEAGSNFGFSVSWWDRLFGTYRAPTPIALGSPALIGLPDAPPQPEHVRFFAVMRMPFRRATTAVPWPRR
jgi:sterol desaturase/sphingolipid hydroxylase (fatty acid hydroxylase superfamily)